MDNGILAGSVGRLIGTGPGRGIGLMLLLAGGVMVTIAFLFAAKKSIRDMERRSNEPVTPPIGDR